MLKIELKQLRFHAFHGLYKEEKITGGDFIVDVTIAHEPLSLPVEQLAETIDYSAAYTIVKRAMGQPTALLETIAAKLAADLLYRFTQAGEVQVSITKLHPPIIAFQGEVRVSCTINRKDLHLFKK